MQKLVQGIHQFREHIFRSEQEFFERLILGQRPETLFITCSDSRINPNLLTQTRPGELFILRNAGGIVPASGTNVPKMGAEEEACGELATIEYAVTLLGVKDIIICGHSHCGAMQALLTPQLLERLPALQSWLRHAERTERVIRDQYSHLEGEALVTATVQENVLSQLENLRTHPAVAARLESGELHVHGWVYKIETGEVFSYDPASGQFQPIAAVKDQVGSSARVELEKGGAGGI